MNFWWPHEMRQRYMNGELPRGGARRRRRAAGIPAEALRHAAELERGAPGAPDMPRLVVIAATGTRRQQDLARRVRVRLPHGRAQRPVHVAVLGDLKGAKFIEHERIHELGETLADAPQPRARAGGRPGDRPGDRDPQRGGASSRCRRSCSVALGAEQLTQALDEHRDARRRGACYPCHRLHADWRGCRQDPDTKFAACQSAITPMAAVQLSERLLGIERRAAA
jgi:hypothetical protein